MTGTQQWLSGFLSGLGRVLIASLQSVEGHFQCLRPWADNTTQRGGGIVSPTCPANIPQQAIQPCQTLAAISLVPEAYALQV